METVEYAPGRAADVHRGDGAGHVLLWHGRGPNERGALATLAGLVADRGPTVLVADWDSTADDGGRADLLRSARFTREVVGQQGADPDSLVLVGWSLGGTAAVGLTIHARRLGVAVAHTVTLAGGFTAPDPISGELLTGLLPGSKAPTPFTLIHGIADDVAPAAASRAMAQSLGLAGWPVEVVELATDHLGIAGADEPPSHAVVVDVAERIASLA